MGYIGMNRFVLRRRAGWPYCRSRAPDADAAQVMTDAVPHSRMP